MSFPPTTTSATFIYLHIHEPMIPGNLVYCLNIYIFLFEKLHALEIGVENATLFTKKGI